MKALFKEILIYECKRNIYFVSKLKQEKILKTNNVIWFYLFICFVLGF